MHFGSRFLLLSDYLIVVCVLLELAILISRLLLRMHSTYVAALFGLPLKLNGMQRTQFELSIARNGINRVLTMYHVKLA